VTWVLVAHPEVRQWLIKLRHSDRESAYLVGAAIQHVLENGPGTGRPLVDTLRSSNMRNLKELRPGSSGTSEIRILFVFDCARRMMLLVAGDKAGRWSEWYERAIPLAEARYQEMIKEGGDDERK
jgi:hypothetical protein